jgi:uncharacterized protein YcfL
MRKGRILLLPLLVLAGCSRNAPPVPDQVRAAAPQKEAAASVTDSEIKAGDASIKQVNGQQVIKAGDVEITLPKD